MKVQLYIFAAFVFCLVCGSPFLFTLESDYFDFTKTGDIGSTIGGITAPIVGLASVFLLTYTLLEQIKINAKQIENNQKQKRMAFEEQFKSVFFSLLQVQRNFAESITGELFFLADKVSEEISDGYFKDKYKIFKADPSRAHKEIFTIKKREDINRTNGNQFFVNSKHQLQCLRFSIGYKKYYKDYDDEAAFDLEERLSDEYLNNLRYEYLEEEIDNKFSNRRAPLRAGYYNAKYDVSENAYNRYHEGDKKKKIAITYLHFYYKQPNLRHYFKHLLALLRYVKESEDECVRFERQQNEIDILRTQFKSQAQFIASQMTIDEMVIVFYHAFLDNEFRELIIKYDLLKDLVLEDVLVGSNCLEGYILKSRGTIINQMLEAI